MPGRLLAGAYPRDISALQALGVTLFLDLTEPGEYGLEPYDARALRRPIRDFDTPSPDEVRETLDLIDAEVDAGGVVYLHCYGGVGRTGTVVGCYLVRHGTPAEDAVEAIARLRAGTRDESRSSPETDEQRALIESWPSHDRRGL